MKILEHVRQVRRRDAETVVHHANQRPARLGRQLDTDVAFGWTVFERVRQQVLDHAPHAGRIDLGHQSLGRRAESNVAVGLDRRLLGDRVAHQWYEVNLLSSQGKLLPRLQPSRVEQLVDHRAHVNSGLVDAGERRIDLLGRGALGAGDTKLALLIGAMAGMPGVFNALFFGVALGGLGALFYLTVLRRGRKEFMPYGPYLAAGAIIFFFLASA